MIAQETIGIINPKTGVAHEVPFQMLPQALQAGGQFADENQKRKAIALQQGTSFVPEAPQFQKTSPNQEKTGLMGVLSDALSALRGATKAGIEFGRKLPEEIPAAWIQIKHDPLRAIENVGAGGIDIAKSIINMPRELGYYLKRKQLPTLPESVLRILPKYPEDIGVEKYLGLDQPQKGDVLLRGLPGLYLGGKALKELSSALKAPDVTKKLKDVQQSVNRKTDDIGEILNSIEQEVYKKGISKIAIDNDLIEQAKDYLPKTKANKTLIEKAQTGDYASLRKLQADLRVKGEKALGSDLVAENDLGAEILDLRHDINRSIHDHLVQTGNENLANKLNDAIKSYKNIKDTYFSSPGLARVFGESQKIPKNVLSFLTEDSTEMNAFKAAHPEIEKILSKALKSKKRRKTLTTALKIAGYGTATGASSKLFDKR